MCVEVREHSIELDKVNTWQQQEEHRARDMLLMMIKRYALVFCGRKCSLLSESAHGGYKM